MDNIINKKLEILSDAAKYDVSCSSSGVGRNNKKSNSMGNTHAAGICHSWSADGRCISLLKVLLSNKCVYDCMYCINRSSSSVDRASFTPDEIARLTLEFYRRNYIEGLFLSSAIEKSPNHTMEKIYNVLSLLRNKYYFNGYIHVKGIPGADNDLITSCGYLCDRMSVNIELPTKSSLHLLAPQKPYEKLLTSMQVISNGVAKYNDEKKYFKSSHKFVPGGQSTQMIVGATGDSDLTILSLTERLYKSFDLKRVYYSAYVPTNNNPLLPSINTIPPLLREHRLYQADWLLRFYDFTSKDIFINNNEYINTQFDPKMFWALNNLHFFPMEINKVSFQELIKIPGIGHTSAKRIVKERRIAHLDFSSLKKTGCVIKRAKYFITCKGKYYGTYLDKEYITKMCLGDEPSHQLSIFD